MTLHVYLRATKKAEKKPYLAKLGAGAARTFAKRARASNTSYAFALPVAEGDVLEARGAIWMETDGLHAARYSASGAFWFTVKDGALFGLSRDQAMMLADGRLLDGTTGDRSLPTVPGNFGGVMLPPNVELIDDTRRIDDAGEA